MRWICALLVVSAVASCSRVSGPVYYQIPLVMEQQAGRERQQSGEHTPAIWVDQVALPDYLAGNGIVYQTSDVKYVIASSNLWASPLEQQLKLAMVTSLSSRLADRMISDRPLGLHPDTLNVNVTGFHGRYDGRAVVTGDWVLQCGDEIFQQDFRLILPQHSDGYNGLVETLGQGWQQVSDQIARQAVYVTQSRKKTV